MARRHGATKRGDGRWQASLGLGGNKRAYFYGRTKEEAISRRDEAKSRALAGRLVEGDKQFVRDFLASWVDDTKAPALRPGSHVEYRIRLGHVMPYLGHLRLRELRPEHIEGAYARLSSEKGLHGNTIAGIHTTLSSALKLAVERNKISRNPCATVHPPQVVLEEMHTLDAAQASALLKATDGTRHQALWAILLTTGLRIGEALALRWEDVDRTGMRLHVLRGVRHIRNVGLMPVEPKTAKSKRVIPLPPAILPMLSAHGQRQREARLRTEGWEDQGLVFPDRHGGFMAPGTAREALHVALERAGLPQVRLHDLRHSYASIYLRMPNASIKKLSEYMGHASIVTTLRIYAHCIPAMDEEAAAWMDQMVLGGKT